jgi:hypothetical protein
LGDLIKIKIVVMYYIVSRQIYLWTPAKAGTIKSTIQEVFKQELSIGFLILCGTLNKYINLPSGFPCLVFALATELLVHPATEHACSRNWYWVLGIRPENTSTSSH